MSAESTSPSKEKLDVNCEEKSEGEHNELDK